MEPVTTAAVIGAGSHLLGGLLGNRSARRESQREYERQKEFAQMGVRWKVADAKAAGLHPLYALGGTTASYTPIQVGSNYLGEAVRGMGQDISRAVAAQQTQEERDVAELQKNEVRSRIRENDARAWYYQSEAMRNESAGVGPPMPVPGVESPPGGIPGQVQSVPDKVTSPQKTRPNVTAANHAGWQSVVMSESGLQMYMPRGDTQGGWAETWGELSATDKLFVLQYNYARRGRPWLDRAARELLWNDPAVSGHLAMLLESSRSGNWYDKPRAREWAMPEAERPYLKWRNPRR